MAEHSCSHQPAAHAGKDHAMSTLTQASHQWAARPNDERYVDLPSMLAAQELIRSQSRAVVVASRALEVHPQDDNTGLMVSGPNGHAYAPTHWSFGQLAQLAEAPAGYLRTMPAPIAADCLNFGLRFRRPVEDIGVLLYRNGEDILRSVNGPNYGRIWNADVIRALIDAVGDGLTGDWRVPGEFGKAVEVTKANTTLYASDRDMFVFLADEDHRIEIPNRRYGQPGTLARGFFLSQSEVGKAKLSFSSFLFDYVCCNRMVWGAENFAEISIRHTSGAPARWLDEVRPALTAYANASASHVTDVITSAQTHKIEDVDAFLSARFGKRLVDSVKSVHQSEEGRPIETLWDATTAITAYARGIEHQDARVELERQGGAILDLAR